ncbi:MAG: LptF/LptG family permease [Chitinivibrionales bacterium]|nr:LptF/LptG family permease [Chitinivibrionales bacterium]MBD3395680.1 LptF/LptG family permease [Chitinivibrionales bacterium]
MILYRHIVREHILPFVYSLSLIVFIFVMQLAVELLDRILTKGLDFSTVFEIFLVNLAWMIALAVPMAVLVATLTAFGRMSADSEIMAIKASGLNLYYLITPVFLASLVLAALLVFFNNLVLPDANHRHSSLMSDISRKKPAALIEPNVLIKDFRNYAIHVRDVYGKTGKIWGVKIFQDVPGEDPTTTVADSGEIHVTRDEKYVQVTLYNGEAHSIDRENAEEYFIGRFDKQVIFIENVDSELRRTERDYRGDREKSASMMLDDVAGFREQKKRHLEEHSESLKALAAHIARLDSLAALSAQHAPDPKLDSIITFEAWIAALEGPRERAARDVQREKHVLERTIRRARQQSMKINQYMAEVHKKYSIPFTCIVFVLIGAPLGIMAKRGGLAVGATYSVFFFVVFWGFLIGGESLADRLIVSPFVAMWSGNFLLTMAGVFLIVRMIRETTFISLEPVQRAWYRILHFKSVETTGRRYERVKGVLFGVPVWLANKAAGILPTYIVRLFAKYLVGVFAALIVVFVVIDYVGNMKVFESARVSDVLLYYWYYLAWFLTLIAPIAVLLASMFAMGTLAKHSEVTAMKAAGISIRRMTIPLLFLGLILSGAVFYFAEKVIPEANARRKELREDLQAGRQYRGRRGHTGQRYFHRNFFYFGTPNIVYCFQEFRTHPQRSRNVWRETFRGNRIVERIQADKLLYEDGTWFFVSGQKRSFGADTSSMAAFDTLVDTVLTATPQEMVTRIKSVEEMSYWELRDAIEKAKRRGEKAHKYESDLHFKIALPFMNFIVILLGLSVTARAGRKGGAVMFGIGLIIVFSYWILARLGLALGQDDRLPPLLAAWGGNIIFFVLGLFLYRQAAR